MSQWFLFFAQILFFTFGAWYFLRNSTKGKQFKTTISMEENEKEMQKLYEMRQTKLTEPLSEQTRPKSLDDVVGQEKGIRALRAALCGTNPQHIRPATGWQNSSGTFGIGRSKKKTMFPFWEKCKICGN